MLFKLNGNERFQNKNQYTENQIKQRMGTNFENNKQIRYLGRRPTLKTNQKVRMRLTKSMFPHQIQNAPAAFHWMMRYNCTS